MPDKDPIVSKNSISLAGEFAALSQLALRGYDANMTLGHTKNVDILVSDPESKKMYQLEVKTNYRNTRNQPHQSKIFGSIASSWIMDQKHEKVVAENLFYCFVNISKNTNEFKFYIVPSHIVAEYVAAQHQLWMKLGASHRENPMRQFRIGIDGETYAIPTPTVKRYENKWDFKL